MPHKRLQLQSFPALTLRFLRRSRGNSGEATAAFFSRLAIVMLATPVVLAMLRCELHSTSKAFTCAD